MIKRRITILAHRFNWHYAPVIGPIDGHPDGKDRYQRWCQWCGFRESYCYDPRVLLGAPINPIDVDSELIEGTEGK